VILDEVQRAPDLFSYLQEIADTIGNPASYVLTGSQQFLLMERISQSLAGRIINFKLFPFTYNEISGNPFDEDIRGIFKIKPLSDKDNIIKSDDK
jgi:predicted AAA+ superfamily ATPase